MWVLRVERLFGFYHKIRNDSRISPTHISLYFALLNESVLLQENSFVLRREAIMTDAKIFSPVTYNRCMKDLHEYGYIEYRPSFANGKSEVLIVELGL